MIALAVTQHGITADTNHSDISFVDAVDESDAIREKIRTEMDNYKKIKDMLFKNKLLSSTTTTTTMTESTSVIESTTLMQNDPTTESTTVLLLETTTIGEIPLTSSEPAFTSSTVRPISINLDLDDIEEEDDAEDSPTDVNYDDTTITPGTTNSSMLEDRFILNAPVICKNGRVPDQSGKCRKIVT